MTDTIVVIVAIVTIGGLAALALSLGYNGALLSTTMTIIGGLAGYRVGKHRRKPKPEATTVLQRIKERRN